MPCQGPFIKLMIIHLSLFTPFSRQNEVGIANQNLYQNPLFSSMEKYRSKSYADGRYQIQSYNGTSNGGGGGGGAPTSYAITSMQDLRCYSASYATSVYQTQAQMGTSDVKFKKGKSTNGSTSKRWSFNDPELQRKKRVASYKVYAVEGKVKGSFKKSFRWIKERCSRVINGNWK